MKTEITENTNPYGITLRHTLRGQHKENIWEIAWSPDGTMLASSSCDAMLSLWNPQTGEHLRNLEGYIYWVTAVAWSPDGTTLASGSSEHDIHLWDPYTGKSIRKFSGYDGDIYSLAWSPNGKLLASGSYLNTIRIWDTESGQVIQQIGKYDAVANEPLVWESRPEARRRVAEYIASPLLLKMLDIFKAIVDPIRQETALVDIHGTAASTAETVAVLQKIYEELRKQGENKASLSSNTPSPTQPTIVQPAPSIVPTVQSTASTVSTPQSNSNDDDFDVFLCYNSADRASVEQIAKQLENRGIHPWFDKWELIPGRSWQQALATQIKRTKSATVFVGKAGMGPWHQMEMEALLRRFAARQCPVIPVLLPGSPEKPDLPVFLENAQWVDFNQPEDEPLEQLIVGITGQHKPRR